MRNGVTPVQRDRRERLERLFDESLSLPAWQRLDDLERHCAGDTSLRVEPEELLKAHGSTGVLDNAPGTFAPAMMPPSLGAGARLGD